MDQSFNVSLAEAADLVAIRARVGYSRFGREKSALDFGNVGNGALIGGGLGAGAGLFNSLTNEDENERKNWLSNSMSGGLVGAGVGGAAGLGLSAYQNLKDSTTPTQNRVAELEAARKAQPPIQDHAGGMLSQLLGFSPTIPTGTSAQDREIFGQRPDLMPGHKTLYENTMDYAQRPGDLAAGGLAGGVVGHGVDLARKGGFNLDKVQGLNEAQLKGMGGVGPEITNFQKAMQAAAKAGGTTTGPTNPSLWQRLRGGAGTGPSVNTPLHGPTAGAAGPAAGMSRDVMHRNLWNSWRKPVMQATKTPRAGKAIGTGIGTFLAPTLSRMMDPVK